MSGGRCGAGCGADEWEWPLAGGSASLIFGRSGLVSARVISVEAGPGIGVLTARATRAIVPWVTAPMVIEIGALAEVVARLPPLRDARTPCRRVPHDPARTQCYFRCQSHRVRTASGTLARRPGNPVPIDRHHDPRTS